MAEAEAAIAAPHSPDWRGATILAIFAFHGFGVGTLYSRIAEIQAAAALGEIGYGVSLVGLPAGAFTGALFVTQAQLDAATGDGGTRLPARRTRPSHWDAGSVAPLGEG